MGLAPAVPAPPARWVARAEPDPPLQPGLRPFWPEPSPLAADRERVYLSRPRGDLQAVDLPLGEEQWSRTLAPMPEPPIPTPDGLLVTEAHALVLLDPATGNERSRRAFPDATLDGVALGEGVVLLAAGPELLLLRP
jgi:hypothetical protein